MEIEYKNLKNKNYFERFREEFFPPLIVIVILSFISYKLTDLNFILFIILGYSIIWGFVTHFMVRNSVTKIVVVDNEILIEGLKMNKKWSKSNNIDDTSVKIKSQGYGRGNVEYYLKIYFNEDVYVVNKRKEWDYNDLIKIYNHISEENNIDRNEELLEKMKLKAKGYSSFKISFGKNNK